MLETEYRKKQQAIRDKRSWTITIILGFFALLAWSGIITIWKYIGHDGYIIVSALIPLAFLAIVLSFCAISGNKQALKNVGEAVLSLFYWWP
jgi:hypothetical protein